MSDEKKHIQFTASDIAKYHKGLLSGREMHALERAALEDPFLAEALEGYSTGKTNVSDDLEELKQRLGDRIKGGKIVNISTISRKGFFWLRAAAMIILVAGAGFLVYQYALNKKSSSISEVNALEKEKQTNDSIASRSLDANDSIARTNAIEQPQKDNAANTRVERKMESAGGNGLAKSEQPFDSAKINQGQPRENKPAVVEEANEELATVRQTSKDDQPGKKVEDKAVVSAAPKTTDQKLKTEMKGLDRQKKDNDVSANDPSKILNNQNGRAFRGKVIDPSNNPVPFANITNAKDNLNTYADASGNFNLIAQDSVLNVQVRSVGYENNNAQLRSDVTNNQIVLQGDRNALNEVVVINSYGNAKSRERQVPVSVEQPEPADGWDNYDTYLINNVTIPEEAKAKSLTGDVSLSFDINKRGNPINIKIEKSLCETCDKEAIRVVQSGPKWKRKPKKARASVKVPF